MYDGQVELFNSLCSPDGRRRPFAIQGVRLRYTLRPFAQQHVRLRYTFRPFGGTDVESGLRELSERVLMNRMDEYHPRLASLTVGSRSLLIFFNNTGPPHIEMTQVAPRRKPEDASPAYDLLTTRLTGFAALSPVRFSTPPAREAANSKLVLIRLDQKALAFCSAIAVVP